MKYLLFDQRAVAHLVSTNSFQSIEYSQGYRLVQHICGKLQSEVLGNVVIEYCDEGILFVGKKKDIISPEEVRRQAENGLRIFCIDLTCCEILVEKDNPADLLTVLQKSLRTVSKIWNRQPFTQSERVHGTKSIVFPFVMSDRRRMVIERSNNVPRLEKRSIKFPLLAYKYNAEDPPHGEEIVNTDVLRDAGEEYYSKHIELQRKFTAVQQNDDTVERPAVYDQVTTTSPVGRDEFIYLNYNTQFSKLTDAQRYVVEYDNLSAPLRIDGAAGTGKTASLIMRAYRLLTLHKKEGKEFRVVFFTHSESTNRRNRETFELYEDSGYFLNPESLQTIQFSTLLDYCTEIAKIPTDMLIERDASDAKTYQLLMIQEVVERAKESNRIRTYRALLSERLRGVFDAEETSTLCAMLQHEFSIQIKGRTNCTIDSYYDIPSIANGLPCHGKKDKELIFSLFSDYQNDLDSNGYFDVDDVVIEALSRFDAPVWRRERARRGYDYIFVDEMHLFNVNEQSVFHYLTRDMTQKEVPICFALDYSQAIGDRGDVNADYIEKAFGASIAKRKYRTVFRNSPQIADFCASIAASGTLMFQENFSNPYSAIQSNFTEAEERKCSVPTLYMYANDEDMLKSLGEHISETMRSLQCRSNEIAVISFDTRYTTEEGITTLERVTGKTFSLLDYGKSADTRNYVLASPYDINGLEFQAVILIGVDEGRVPQTVGVSDISKHFIKYSAYNLLYLASSRAKYKLILLGNSLNGMSSCLEYSKEANRLSVEIDGK